MKEIKALLKVKSLMTLCVMGVFTYMSVTNKLDPAVTASTITAVVTYYFTKENLQASKMSAHHRIDELSDK